MTVSPLVFGQQKKANISFDKTLHDFGKFKEEDGVKTYSFTFTNTGSEALIIQRVTSSCGCTTPSWTKQPIAPGEKGSVSAAYNPRNRPGHFDKYISVESNSAVKSQRLQITGSVIAKELTIEDKYTFAMGGIRLKSNHLSFGTIYKTTPQTRLLELINTSDVVQKIEIRNTPAHIKANVLTPNVNPGETGSIEIIYLSDKQKDWDYVRNNISVYLNGKTDRKYMIVVTANIREDFSSMSPEEKTKAASISFDSKTFNFDPLKQGEKIDYEYTFTNTGKSDLIIRKVRASCGCTAVLLDATVIPPGKKGGIKVSFNSAGKKGNQNKTVTVITNDPAHQREILWIKGQVVI